MTNNVVSATIEILGKPYPIRCPESEIESLKQAARYLDQKMAEVRESGKAINLERIAIITALNITYQLLQRDQQKEGILDKINHQIKQLQDKVEHAIHQSIQTELVYSGE